MPPTAVPMSFIWPAMLWGLVALPLLVGAYLWLLRRRKRRLAKELNKSASWEKEQVEQYTKMAEKYLT